MTDEVAITAGAQYGLVCNNVNSQFYIIRALSKNSSTKKAT